MAERIIRIIEDELRTARGRVAFLAHALAEAQRFPQEDVLQLRRVLRAHGLTVIASDALRVALDQFDLADQVGDDGLSEHADHADVDAARRAILEAWEAAR